VIHLIALGEDVGLSTLDELAAGLAKEFRDSCHVREERVDIGFAFDPVRKQYHATSILRHLTGLARGARLLGVTAVDLCVPIFTFVFGEAQVAGQCAVVSMHRLREEFYGLPGNRELTATRLLKEAVHELGHTYGLRHCADWQCAMASSHTIDRLDLKGTRLCGACRRVAVNAQNG
jgi:archaemetzincin